MGLILRKLKSSVQRSISKNSNRARPDEFRREIGIDDNTPLIGNVGMIRPDKGQARSS